MNTQSNAKKLQEEKEELENWMPSPDSLPGEFETATVIPRVAVGRYSTFDVHDVRNMYINLVGDRCSDEIALRDVQDHLAEAQHSLREEGFEIISQQDYQDWAHESLVRAKPAPPVERSFIGRVWNCLFSPPVQEPQIQPPPIKYHPQIFRGELIKVKKVLVLKKEYLNDDGENRGDKPGEDAGCGKQANTQGFTVEDSVIDEE
jgi:hypothetical protein